MSASDMNLVFVDVEATGASPYSGVMTEFGAVHYATRSSFHGVLHLAIPDPANPTKPLLVEAVNGKPVRPISAAEVMESFTFWLAQLPGGRPIFVSDNPGYDFMWIAHIFDSLGRPNPFGHSSRRIGDFYAGLVGDFANSSRWKKLRITRHTHHPVYDAMGNVEAFSALLRLAAALPTPEQP